MKYEKNYFFCEPLKERPDSKVTFLTVCDVQKDHDIKGNYTSAITDEMSARTRIGKPLWDTETHYL